MPAKLPATKPAPAKKAMPAKKPAAPVSKPVAAKPVASAAKAAAKPMPAPKSAPAPKAAAKPAPTPAPVSKAPAKPVPTPPPAKAVVAPRKEGKIAVAVAAKPSTPAPKGKYRIVQYQTDDATGRPIVPPGYKPSADEEYMSPLQLEYFRQKLLARRAELVEESKQTIENLKEEVRDVGDEAERASRETENALELRTRDRYRKLIGKIDSTLKRVDGGDYGYCVDTGEEIGLDRLEARPQAERTIDAQERWEHLQKQMGD